MKTLKRIAITAILTATLYACGGGASDQPHNAEGFGKIETELKDKFGNDAYYTNIYISHDDRIGNMISVTVTEDPESMKMEQWNLEQNTWTQSSEISLEVSEGSKASDFMYQLNDKANLSIFGELVEKAKTHLTNEKDIENPALDTAMLKYPSDGDIEDFDYSINLKPENGGTTFRFSYDLNGELIKMDY